MNDLQAETREEQGFHKPSLKLSYTLRALRYRNFRLFFAGQLISLIGTWMQTVAQSWLIYRITGSSLLLGTVGFAGQIPVFLIAPLGGIVADRYNRHRIVIATQTASMTLALVLAWLTLTGTIAVWHIVALSALLGLANAFDIPARQSFIVEMVGKADLTNAIALNSSMFNSARMIGPAVAGILVAIIGEGWCFFANGVSYLAVIAGLLMMRFTPIRPKAQADSVLENILEGFQFARNSAPIRLLLLLLALSSLVGTPYTVLMPIFAGEILHRGPRGLGILMAASGIGALLAALTLAARIGLHGLGRWIVLACGGFGLSLVLFAFSRSFWLSVILLIPTGYALMVQMG
ncbi:MAG: MFS transporter, partial [Acidobacteria bacterium]